MPLHRSHRRVSSSVVALVLGLSAVGCSTTVVDSTGSTVADGAEPASPTTAGALVIPPSPADQVEQLVTLTLGLGDEIVDGKPQRHLDDIDALWAAAKPAVHRANPAAEREIEHQLGLVATAVARKRPADADKAANNLAAVAAGLAESW